MGKQQLDWSKFNDKLTNAAKGKEFENLVYDLLKAEYPNYQWNDTKASWDGSKDFTGTAINSDVVSAWAECKNYSKNISLVQFSNTFIMATVDKIDTIYFFSKSKAVDNAKKNIGVFCEMLGKNYTIIDGENLENIILNNEEIKNKYFPNDSSKSNEIKPDISVQYIKNPTVNSDDGHSSENVNNELFLKKFEQLGVRLLIQNNSKADLNLKFEIIFNDYFALLNEKYRDLVALENGHRLVLEVQLKKFEYKVVTIHFKTIKYTDKEGTIPPKVILLDSTLKIKYNPNIKVIINNIKEINLIGNNLYNLNTIQKTVNSNRLEIITLEGPSGTGKSRLSSESKLFFISNNYIATKKDFETEQNEFNLFKNIIKELFLFPNNTDQIYENGNCENDDYIKNLNEKVETLGSGNNNKIIDFIYGSTINNLDDVSGDLISVIVKSMNNKNLKYCIIIDNLQEASEVFIQKLKLLIDEFTSYKFNVTVIQLVNTDLINDRQYIYNYLNKFKNLSLEGRVNAIDTNQYTTLYTANYSIDDRTAYFEQMLGNLESKFNKAIINELINSELNNPFQLNHMLSILDVINTNNKFDNNNSKFSKYSEVLALAFERIKNNLRTTNDDVIDSILIIIYFDGYLSESPNLNQDVIIELLRFFIIKKENNKYYFYHSFIYSGMSQKFEIQVDALKNNKRLLSNFSKKFLGKYKASSLYFDVNNECGEFTLVKYEKYFRYIKDSININKILYISNLQIYLFNISDISTEMLFDKLYQLIDLSINVIGFNEKRVEFLCDIYDQIIDCLYDNIEQDFSIKLANVLLRGFNSGGEYNKSINFVNDLLEEIDSKDKYNNILFRHKKVQACINSGDYKYALNEIDTILKIIDDVLETLSDESEKIGYYDMQYECYLSKSKIAVYFNNDSYELKPYSYYASKAVQIYKTKLNYTDVDANVRCDFINYSVCISYCNTEEEIINTSNTIKDSLLKLTKNETLDTNITNAYFYNYGLSLYIISLIKQYNYGTEEQSLKIKNLFDVQINSTISNGPNNRLAYNFLSKAKYLILINETGDAYEYIKKSYDTYVKDNSYNVVYKDIFEKELFIVYSYLISLNKIYKIDLLDKFIAETNFIDYKLLFNSDFKYYFIPDKNLPIGFNLSN